MAIGYVTGGEVINASFASSDPSASFDSGTSGSDRYLLVVVQNEWQFSATTAVTYNGVSMTKVVEEEIASNFSTRLQLWTLANPDTGSNTLALTKNGSGGDILVTAWVYSGTSGVGATAKGSAEDQTPAISVTTTAANSWVFSAFGARNENIGPFTPDANIDVERYEEATVFGARGERQVICDSSESLAGSVTHSGTWTGPNQPPGYAAIIAELLEASSGVTASASITATEGNDTASAAAVSVSDASIAVTEGDDTSTLTAVAVSDATIDATEGDDTASLTGEADQPSTDGAISATEGDDVASLAGVSVSTASLSATEGNDSASLDGVLPGVTEGAAAATEADDSASLSGVAIASGSLTSTETDDSASLSGVAIAYGSLSATEADDTASLAGATDNTTEGTLAATEADDSASLAGVAVTSGSIAATEGDDAASLAGQVVVDVTGAITVTEQDDSAQLFSGADGARGMTPAMIGELSKATVIAGYLVEAEFDSGALRLTDLAVDVDFDGNTFERTAGFLGFSGLAETGELLVNQITVSLAGVDTSIGMTKVLQDEFIDRPLRIWLAFIDQTTGLLVPDPVKVFDGRMDAPTINEDPDGGTSTITVRGTPAWVDYGRRPGRHWNDSEQQFYFSGDLGMEFVSQEPKNFVWGRA